MKKIILSLVLTLIAFSAFSQLATQSDQVIQTATLTLIKKGTDTLNQTGRLQATAALQTAANATLVASKKGIDTLNQRLRLQATAALQTAANATLVASKKGIDTLNQYARFQATAALQTAGNATLVASKKGIDTLNQYARVQATAALQTAGNATLVGIKKGTDTTNQAIRALKLVVDSINQATKFKIANVACTSTNVGTTYGAGYVINGGSTTGYSVSFGSGNWVIERISMYPTTSSTVLDINVSAFSGTITPGADNTAFASSTTFNGRYLGTMNLSTTTPFTGSQIYTSKPVLSTASMGDSNIYCNTTNGTVYLLLWANSAFTPPTGEVYNLRIVLRKLN